MKLFEQQEPVERKEPERVQIDKSYFIKRNMAKAVNRDPKVCEAIEKWLLSFEGGISKIAFTAQMKRLDYDDAKALEQLERAIGRRIIPLPPPPKMPPLPTTLVEQMVKDTFVAVTGKKFKPAIKEAIDFLKPCGTVYVLSVEDFIVEFKGYEDKGKAPKMIEKAIEADVLVVVGLERAIHLEWHISEAINRIGRLREERHKPIISTWYRYNDCNEFFERFKIYSID